jgi:hypothetical protein
MDHATTKTLQPYSTSLLHLEELTLMEGDVLVYGSIVSTVELPRSKGTYRIG